MSHKPECVPDVDFLPEEWREGYAAEELSRVEDAALGCGGYFDDEGRLQCDACGTEQCEDCEFSGDIGRVPREISEEVEP